MASAARRRCFRPWRQPARGTGPEPPDNPGCTAQAPEEHRGRVPTQVNEEAHMANDLQELERLSRELGGARSALDDRLGITYIEATADRFAAAVVDVAWADGKLSLLGVPTLTATSG